MINLPSILTRALGTTLLLLFISLLSGCEAAPKTPQLVRSDNLSKTERASWREALNFPHYCKDGKYEWDDDTSPEIGFLDFQQGRYLVYNVCGLIPYQTNLFLVNVGNNSVPSLLNFSIPTLINEDELSSDSPLKESLPEDEMAAFGLDYQQKAKYKLISIQLVSGGFFIDEEGLLVIDHRRNGGGTCGVYSRYQIENNQAQLVDFRAQESCVGSPDVSTWKHYDAADVISE